MKKRKGITIAELLRLEMDRAAEEARRRFFELGGKVTVDEDGHEEHWIPDNRGTKKTKLGTSLSLIFRSIDQCPGPVQPEWEHLIRLGRALERAENQMQRVTNGVLRGKKIAEDAARADKIRCAEFDKLNAPGATGVPIAVVARLNQMGVNCDEKTIRNAVLRRKKKLRK